MIGIDIAAIERFEKISQNDFSHWEKAYSKDEWEYAFAAPAPAQQLASIFAAKEAVMKAVGGDLVGRFDQVAITHHETGEPTAEVTSESDKKIHLSISHDAGMVAAVALVQ